MNNQEHPTSVAQGRFFSFKSLALAVLIALNALLALSLTGVLRFQPTAHAGGVVQGGGRVSDYMILPSHPLGLSQDVLFILDTENARLTAAGYDVNRGIEFTTPLDLRRR